MNKAFWLIFLCASIANSDSIGKPKPKKVDNFQPESTVDNLDEDFSQPGSRSDSSVGGNSNSRFVSSSSSSVSVSSRGDHGRNVRIIQRCINGVCEVCVNENCWENVEFTAIKVEENCPVAACAKSCSGFKIFVDDCPICECEGFATREPCDSDADCGNAAGPALCQENLCRYPALTPGLPAACDYTYQCPATQECSGSGRCVPGNLTHSSTQSRPCFWDSDCESGYRCSGMTCFEGGRPHSRGRQCIFDFQCPSGSLCDRFTCYDVGVEHSAQSCIFSSHCRKPGEACERMSCLPRGTRAGNSNFRNSGDFEDFFAGF